MAGGRRAPRLRRRQVIIDREGFRDARELYADAWKRGPGPLVRRALRFAPAGGRAADLGCGVGQDAIHLARNGFRVLAIDHGAVALEFLARQRVPGVSCRLADLRHLRLRAGTYDLIHAARSLPFLGTADLQLALERIARALRRGGVLSCHLFGRSDGLRVTTMTPERAVELLAALDLDILHFVVNELRTTRTSRAAEVFEIVARRPPRAVRGHSADCSG